MLFLAKLNARVALLVMLGLLIVSNLWAQTRGFALGDLLAFNGPTIVYVVLGLTFSASLDSVIYILAWITGFSRFLNSFKAGYTRLFTHVGLPAIFAGGLLAGLGEETFFRGVLQRELGILPVAVLFALAHAGRGLTLFTGWAFIEGLVFGALYQISGNLLVPMLVHGIHDSAGMFFGRYIYGRYLPPAATLAEWLRALSAPARLVLETTLLPGSGIEDADAPAAMSAMLGAPAAEEEAGAPAVPASVIPGGTVAEEIERPSAPAVPKEPLAEPQMQSAAVESDAPQSPTEAALVADDTSPTAP